jgi:hypothetical protein
MRVVCDIPLEVGGGQAVKALLDCLSDIWAAQLRRKPLPPLYSTGVRYEREPNAGQWEDFKPPYRTFEDGFGDCDDLVLWRVAELKAKGERASVQCLVKADPTGLKMHVRVRRADGREEDPSVLVERFKVEP